ncbi:MAG: hypothetical protein RLN83_07045 [Balneola sp.]
MELIKAQNEFIQTWGALGSSWGIPKSMAQIHALLITSPSGLSTEEIMDRIQLSRGNVNINVRELVNWKLVSKKNVLGERKEFFVAHHDIWGIAKNIVTERKKRELLPIKELLTSLKDENFEGSKSEVEHFTTMIKELEEFVLQMDQLTELLVKMNDNKFFKKMIKMLA